MGCRGHGYPDPGFLSRSVRFLIATSLALLVFAYAVRFFPQALSGIDTGLARAQAGEPFDQLGLSVSLDASDAKDLTGLHCEAHSVDNPGSPRSVYDEISNLESPIPT